MKKELLDFIAAKGANEYVSINDQLKLMFNRDFEKAKKLLREINSEGLADIQGELFRLGSTQGDTRLNWEGKQEDCVKLYDFNNVPIKAKIREYEIVNN